MALSCRRQSHREQRQVKLWKHANLVTRGMVTGWLGTSSSDRFYIFEGNCSFVLYHLQWEAGHKSTSMMAFSTLENSLGFIL